MSAHNNQEQLRDDIASMLELSRASWRVNAKDRHRPRDEGSDETNSELLPFPRSLLFKTISRHPLMLAAVTAIVWRLGPAKFGAMAVAGAGLFIRHRFSAMAIAQQLFSSSFFKKPRKTRTR